MQLLFQSELPQLPLWFRDYIQLTYGEKLDIREMPTHLEVWINENSPHYADIVREKTQFLQNPFDSRYQQSAWQTLNTAPKQARSPNSFKACLAYLNQYPYGKFTLFITALCLLVYAITQIAPEWVYTYFSYPENYEEQGQLWRYLSHSVVHLSFWHLAFNLLWWWIFATAIERQRGTGKLVLLYLLSAIGSAVVQNWVSGPYFFGLSGVVYAVLGYAYCVDKLTKGNAFNIPQGFALMLLVGILLGFASPLWGIETGNSAHIAGLVIGVVIAFCDSHHKNKQKNTAL